MATGAMLFSAGAQSSSQPILFSTPAGDDAASSAPSQTPEQPNFANELQAPSSDFNFNAAPGEAPLPQPISPATNMRLRQVLDERKNWALMTPAEILGVTTPEKMLGIRERDAAGQEKNLTPLERYWERQQQSTMAATNDEQTGDSPGRRDFSGDGEDGTGASATNNRSPGNSRTFLNGFFNSAPDNNAFGGQGEASAWQKLWGGAPAITPDLAQQAAMERFRQLLNPSPPPAAVTRSSDTIFPLPQMTPPDPYWQQPAVFANPVGASFTPLSSGIEKPTGLTPLPGITSQNNLQPAPTPSWAPQPAPWLSQAPQPFVIPQRKF
jgi:hypothetical protein